MSNLRTLLILLLATSALATSGLAQGKSTLSACSFQAVKYQLENEGPEILVIFAAPPQPGKGPVDWEVIDATAGSVFHIKMPALQGNLTGADLWLASPLDTDHKYFLTVFGLTGCDPDKPPIANVAIPKPSSPTSPSIPSSHDPTQPPASNSGHGLVLGPSKARTDSDIYLSGLVTGATGQKAAYTADIKTQLNYIVRQAHDNSPEFAVLPSFDFTASTNTKQDGNSVTFGLAGRFAWAKQVAPLSVFDLYTVLEPGGAVQTDPYFRVIEPVFRLPIYAIPHPLQWGPVLAYLQPMFGIEAGESTRMPSSGDYTKAPATLPSPGGIFRPFAGGSLYINVNKKSKTGSGSKTVFSVETDYINRWAIIAEPVFSQASTGKLTLLGIGTQPRGYVTTKIARNIGSYFSIALQHDYGELPPLYTKVDNKYSISLTYKASLKAGAGAK